MDKPKRFDRNLVVIGAGAAGLVSAYIAAAVKAGVTLVEAGSMGGDCLNTGCVPSKALIRCARAARQARDAVKFGVRTDTVEVDFPGVMRHVRESIAAIAPHDSVQRYTGLGVEVLQGRARLLDPWRVQVRMNDGGERIVSARSIILATGAEPLVPSLPGLDAVDYATSDTLWEKFAGLERVPQKLLVLGGGAVGCELAQAFARLGAGVTLVEMAGRLLPQEDADISRAVERALVAEGVEVLVGHRAATFEQNRAILAGPNGELAKTFDQLLLALGRRARIEGLGLEALGLVEDGQLSVDAFLRTRYPHILAAGDLVGPYRFTHMAAHQAWYAAVNGLFGDLKKFRVDYSLVPRAVFVDPEIAAVGLTEQGALEQGIPHEIIRYDLGDLDRAIVEGAARGFVKVLTVPGKDRILGVSIAGENAAELMAEFVLAMKNGIGLNGILSTIHSYPTMAEANKYVAGNWKRAHAPQALLRWLERFHRWRRG